MATFFAVFGLLSFFFFAILSDAILVNGKSKIKSRKKQIKKFKKQRTK